MNATQVAKAVLAYYERTKGYGHSTAARMGLEGPTGGAMLVTLKGDEKIALKLSEAPSWASQYIGPITWDNEALCALVKALLEENGHLRSMIHGDFS